MNEENASTGKELLAAAVILAALLWLAASMLDFLWFNTEERGLGAILIPVHNPRDVFMRIFFLSALLLGGLVASRMYMRRALSEKRAREEKNHLDITLNSIGDAVIATDAAGAVARMNPIAEKLTGWTMERAQGVMLTDVFHVIDARTREVCESPVEKVIRSETNVGLADQTVLVSRQGAQHRIADSAAPIRDDDGNAAGVVLVFRDVTEEYRMRARIAKNEERFRQVAMTNWVWETDVNGRYTYCSDNVMDSLGYTADEMVGRTTSDFMPPGEAARVRGILDEIVAAGKPIVDLENRKIAKDGREVYMLTNGVPFLDGAGAVIGYRGGAKDITERKNAENALLASEEKYRILIQSMQQGVFILQNDEIVFANGAFADMVGRSPEEVARTVFPDLVAPGIWKWSPRVFIVAPRGRTLPHPSSVGWCTRMEAMCGRR